MDRQSIDDEDFDYRDDQVLQGTGRSTVVQNQPHDEEVALSDTGSFGGQDDPPNVKDASLIESHDMDDIGPMGGPVRTQSPDEYQAYPQQQSPQQPTARSPIAAVQSTAGSASAAGGDDGPGAYNAMEFKHLNVSDEIRELFSFIGRYKPHNIELETKLKPFIPDYIPSIGGIDEFIKVPRPDGKPDFLGLKVLDEPAAKQSDPTVLTLQLRQHSKEAPGNKAEMIGRIEHSDDTKAKKIQQWISSINDIHKNKPPANVSYNRKMPDIELLMQEWPPEIEAFLKNMKMPSGDLDLDLKTYTRMICSLLDIPVHENPVESLHVLFTLYLEFKNNPIFQQHLDMENKLQGSGTPGGFGDDWRAQSAGSMGAGATLLGNAMPVHAGYGDSQSHTFD